MRDKLYWTIEKFSLRYNYFMFFDVYPYLADQVFIRHRLRVWFENEYRKEGSPYLATFCHVRRRDAAEFLAALEDLKKSMSLCGYPNYEEDIAFLMDSMEALKGADNQNENGASRKAKQKQTA